MIARRDASARPGSCGDANSARFRRASGRDPVAGRVAARDENQHGKPEAVARKAPRASGGRAVLRDRRPTRGRPWLAAAVRTEFRRHAVEAGVRRRFAPHQLRHPLAVELAREGCVAERHPAPARPCQPRHDEHLPAGNRHRGDHLDHARTPSADDVRYGGSSDLKEPDAQSASADSVLALRGTGRGVLLCSAQAVVRGPPRRGFPSARRSSRASANTGPARRPAVRRERKPSLASRGLRLLIASIANPP